MTQAIPARVRASAPAERFAAIVGEPFATPAGSADRVDGIAPRIVVRPASVDEVRAVIRTCGDLGLALVPTGLGRHLDVGAPPERCDVLLRLDRLGGILDHQPADMTATVAAGCSIAVLREALARHGQWLAVDPPCPEATTVGGMIAANLSGPLRASQGAVRDLLLGIEIVAADGALVRGGGRVVKNVAGYDLPKLHVGALGSLGVVVSATFKLRPRPPLERAIAVDCEDLDQAALVALAVRDALDPLWLAIEVPAESEGHPAPAASSAAARAIVGVAGIAAEVEDAVMRVERVAGVRGLASHPIAGATAVREDLASFPLRPAAAVLRASTLPGSVAACSRALVDAAASEGTRVAILADVATGVLRALVPAPRAVAPLVRRLRPALVAGGGYLVVERASPVVKQLLVGDADAWGDVGGGLELMRGVKTAFDPARLLSPGRMPGGI
ncbi:MAG TPA: FAD-binding oxidoreductase [Candidatus Binatia bacterium]|nr:FAD-binding oxidoreductase [Candidatus Binatia bacterium]